MSKEDMDRIHNEINSKLEENLSKYGSLFILGKINNAPITGGLNFDNNIYFIDVFRYKQDNLDCFGIRILTGTDSFDFNSIAVRNGKSMKLQAKNLFEAVDFLCKHRSKIVMIIKKCLDAAENTSHKTLMLFMSRVFNIEFTKRGELSNVKILIADKELEFVEINRKCGSYNEIERVETDKFLSDKYKLML